MSHRNRCNGCGYPIVTDADLATAGIRATRTAAIHWRTCVGKRDWPEYMSKKRVTAYRVPGDLDGCPPMVVTFTEDGPDVSYSLEAVSEGASVPGFVGFPDVADAEPTPSSEAAIIDLGTFRAPCECGWRIPADSRNPEAAMRLHRAKAKQHKAEAVTSG